MTAKKKIWRLTPPSKETSHLALKTGISELNALLLINRGISDNDSVKAFLSPRLSSLIDPMLMKDMDKALELILETIENQGHITVYGDYDADGLTATALLINLFSSLDVNASSYIPHRLKEGYGLNSGAVKGLRKRGTRLIITVDCGISNQKEIELAQQLGMKVIVTDHHQIHDNFNPICPVINPHRQDSSFPFQDLAGVGVAFFLAVGLRAALRQRGWFKKRTEPDLRNYLDLVALGTVADMAPLKGQNRILVHAGIDGMKNSQWPGIMAMQKISGIDSSKVSSYDLAFKLAPRLNASGRMGDAAPGLNALITNSPSTAKKLAEQLNMINRQRQLVEGEIISQIEKSIAGKADTTIRRTMVFAEEGWHKGVLGIVASKLLEKYHKPTLVLMIQDGIIAGSGRSIDGFNLHQALTRLGHLFEGFGGHYHAAGMTLKTSNLEALISGLEEIAREEIRDEDLIPAVRIDSEIRISDITMDTLLEIDTLAPFGSGNPEPVFYSAQIQVINSRVVGEKHLKLLVREGETVMDAIGFNLAEFHPIGDRKINIVFTPEINRWNGIEKPQLRLLDLELAGGETRLVKQKYQS